VDEKRCTFGAGRLFILVCKDEMSPVLVLIDEVLELIFDVFDAIALALLFIAAVFELMSLELLLMLLVLVLIAELFALIFDVLVEILLVLLLIAVPFELMSLVLLAMLLILVFIAEVFEPMFELLTLMFPEFVLIVLLLAETESFNVTNTTVLVLILWVLWAGLCRMYSLLVAKSKICEPTGRFLPNVVVALGTLTVLVLLTCA